MSVALSIRFYQELKNGWLHLSVGPGENLHSIALCGHPVVKLHYIFGVERFKYRVTCPGCVQLLLGINLETQLTKQISPLPACACASAHGVVESHGGPGTPHGVFNSGNERKNNDNQSNGHQ